MNNDLLKRYIDDQPTKIVICNHLMFTHAICVFLKQFFLLIRHCSFELFFIPTNQFQ